MRFASVSTNVEAWRPRANISQADPNSQLSLAAGGARKCGKKVAPETSSSSAARIGVKMESRCVRLSGLYHADEVVGQLQSRRKIQNFVSITL
jgi:hypothetical protein